MLIVKLSENFVYKFAEFWPFRVLFLIFVTLKFHLWEFGGMALLATLPMGAKRHILA